MRSKPKFLTKWLPEPAVPALFSLLTIPFYLIWSGIFSVLVDWVHQLGIYSGPKYWGGRTLAGLPVLGSLALEVIFAAVVLGYGALNLPQLQRRFWHALLLVIFFPAPFGLSAVIDSVYSSYDYDKLLNAPGKLYDILPKGWGAGEIFFQVGTFIVCYAPLIFMIVWLIFGRRIKSKRW